MNLVELTSNLTPTPAAYLKAARAINATPGDELRPVKVGLLSTFTAEFLRPYLTVTGAQRGFHLQSWFAPWGQLEQQVAAGGSELYAQQPEVIVILTRLEELLPSVSGRFLLEGESERRAGIDEVRIRLMRLVAALRTNTACLVFLSNFLPPHRPAAGLADAALTYSEATWAADCNAAVAEVCRSQPGTYLFDLARIAIDHGLRSWVDPKLFHLARVPMSVTAQIATAHGLSRTLRAALVPPAKVLVLDLDNTLWGGVLGEDGIGGIGLGDEYPGNVFKAFHRYLLTLKDRGVLLAVATKNNPADVQEVWERHPDCILKLED
ncbi:MAG: HAD-IIIC family phosphatase, partial [Verrucomicrobiaceae bacterium]